MGHLINPISLRLGISRFWNSKWTVVSSKNKYNFLFKSDWNIYNLVVQLFSTQAFISESYIFSHCIILRTNKVFNLFVFYWDGKTWENIGEEYRGVFHFLKRMNVFKRAFFVLDFFNSRRKALFFFEKYLFLSQNRTRVATLILSIYLQVLLKRFLLIFLSSIRLYNKNYKFSRRFLVEFFFRKLLVFFLKFISLRFLFNNKILYSVVWILVLQKYVFVKIFLLFVKRSKFVGNHDFFEEVLDDSLKWFLFGQKKILSQNIIKYFLTKFFSFPFSDKKLNVEMRLITKLEYTSSFIARYFAIRLRQKFRLMQALAPVFKELNVNPVIAGYRVNCSGRFTKKEIATQKWYRYGRVATSKLKAFVDFSIVPFVLKYSLCSFKVWLALDYSRLTFESINKVFLSEVAQKGVEAASNFARFFYSRYNPVENRFFFKYEKFPFYKRRSIFMVFFSQKNGLFTNFLLKNNFFSNNQMGFALLWRRIFSLLLKHNLNRKYGVHHISIKYKRHFVLFEKMFNSRKIFFSCGPKLRVNSVFLFTKNRKKKVKEKKYPVSYVFFHNKKQKKGFTWILNRNSLYKGFLYRHLIKKMRNEYFLFMRKEHFYRKKKLSIFKFKFFSRKKRLRSIQIYYNRRKYKLLKLIVWFSNK